MEEWLRGRVSDTKLQPNVELSFPPCSYLLITPSPRHSFSDNTAIKDIPNDAPHDYRYIATDWYLNFSPGQNSPPVLAPPTWRLEVG